MIQSSAHITPAHLWVGHHEELVAQTKRWLQVLLTTCNACGVCAACLGIERQQYHAVTWLSPERSYVLDDLQPLFRTLSFALEQGHHHVFVIQHADQLTHACSNSLLKSIEEPPAGYHFVFLTERSDDILPTIRSRCIVQTWQHDAHEVQRDLLATFFMTTDFQSPQAFYQELEQRKPSEHTTLALLDDILGYWLMQARQAFVEGDAKKKKQALRVITLIRLCLTRPLMPGSSKFLWRDLFLQLKLY